MKITACVIALNEADRIAESVRSASVCCDEVLVVDGGSSDDTVSIARAAGAAVLSRAFDDFSSQKTFANNRASNDWILSLDADERVSDGLAAEINALRQRTSGDEPAAGWAFPRHTYYLGRLIRHTWGNDIKPRLFDRRHARWEGAYVHESLRIDGSIATLSSPLLHYTYRDISDHARRVDHYSTLAAMKMKAEGRRASFAGFTVLPLWTFLKFYVFKLGLLDGWPGFVIAAMSSYSVLLKHLKLREMQRAA